MKNLRTFLAVSALLASFSALPASAQDAFSIPRGETRLEMTKEAIAPTIAKTKEVMGNLYAQAKSRLNGMTAEAKEPPRPRVEPFQPPLPVACPVTHWRPLETFSYWLMKVSPKDQLTVATALQTARNTCGINAQEFNGSLTVIENMAFDKYFNDKGSDGVISAIDKLRIQYGEVSSTSASK